MDRSGECIFCRIVDHRADASILYEDEKVVAFHDRYPVAPVHVLVVPRRHIPSLNEADDPEMLGHLLSTARSIAEQLGVAAGGYRALINCQRDGGQVIDHLHLHVIGGRRLGPMA